MTHTQKEESPVTYGDVVGHFICREALLNEILLSPEYEAAVANLGLSDTVDRVRTARAQLEEHQTDEAREYVERAEFALLVGHLGTGNTWAKKFILQHDLPWNWLGDDLGAALCWWLDWQVVGENRRIRWSPPEHDALVPRLEFHTGDPPELVSAALSRLDAFRALLLAARLPPGRVPNKTLVTLERNTAWLFRHRVQHESYRAIARQDVGDAERHTDVKRGIERADRLLSMSV